MARKIDWIAALMEYMIDESMSYAKIAQKYGVSTRRVEKVASREHWYLMKVTTWATVRYRLRFKNKNAFF